MRLKMAENSLFAVLLRSSWWISLAVALAVVAISRMLVPAEYWTYAAAGALPFVVIAALAARRQWREPGARRVADTIEACRAMSRAEFTKTIGDALRRDGHAVSPFTGAAADLELTKGGRVILVACGRWKAARTGVEPLKELQAAQQSRDARDSLYVTLGEVSDAARAYAAQNGIRLVQGAELALILGRLPKR